MRSIDQLRARFGWHAESDENPDIEPLTLEAARNLRLPWLSRFSPQTLRAQIEVQPDYSLWVPATGEFIVGEPWRRRRDIGSIVEVSARKGKPALVRDLVTKMHSRGNRLVMLADDVWRDETRLYMRLGFEKIQTIVFFERNLAPESLRDPAYANLPQLEYTRLSPLSNLDTLLYIDNNSFPWLWWNSIEEFEVYIQMPDVYIIIASADGVPVGYASYTIYEGWAHLDRLAVRNDHQGKRYGAAQLVHVMELMVGTGARTVGLSTQATNVKSHNLYKGFGFHQTNQSVTFYGIKLDSQVTIE